MSFVAPIRPPFARINGQPSLNRLHPLARGMTDCLLWNALVPLNLATPTVKTTLTSSPTLVPTARGYAGYATGGSDFEIPDHGNTVAGDFAIRILSRIVTWTGAFSALVDKGAVGPGRELTILFNTSGNVSFVSFGAVAGGSLSITTGMTAGGTWDFVVSRAGSVATFYVNGVSVGTSSAAAVTGTTAVVTPMSFGWNQSGGGSNADAQYLTAQVWNRALSANEVSLLARAPYCFLTYPQDVQRVGAAATPTFLAAWAQGSNLPVIGTGTY